MIALANKSDRGRIFLFFKNRDFYLSLEKCTVRAWIIERLASLSIIHGSSFDKFYVIHFLWGHLRSLLHPKINNDDL